MKDIRKLLEYIAEHDYAAPEFATPIELARQILPYLGSVDGELREKYVYGTLHQWIVRGVLSDIEIADLSITLIDADHLFLGIDTPGEDAVYMRAFSVLLLAPIVYAHRQAPVLSSSNLNAILTATINYLDRERDLRGYVSGERWWAHGVAHAADVLGQLGQCSDVSIEGLMSMLDAIGRKALTDSTVFVFEEDARMASAAIEILKRPELDSDWAQRWVSCLVPKSRWTGELPQTHHRFLNARNTLRCLFFQSREADLPTSLVTDIEAALAALPER